MTISRPRIAIPEPTSTDEAYNQRSLPQYVRSVEDAGGIAVPISLTESLDKQQALVASSVGILLPGSPADVDPARYGQERQKETAAKDAPREMADDLLMRDAFAQRKPILGICYGLQSLNVWRGGTLIQHLPHAESADRLVVNHAPGRTVERAHALIVAAGSHLSVILSSGQEEREQEKPELFVNSSHHQAVSHPGNSLNIVATSPVDGVI
jgi:putative glutamine amidotransferase